MKSKLLMTFCILALVGAVLGTASNVAAQTVVSKASKLIWDDSNPVGTEWTISSDVGSWWVIVTAANDDGESVVESGPSNEVHYVVIGPPGNVRVVR